MNLNSMLRSFFMFFRPFRWMILFGVVGAISVFTIATAMIQPVKTVVASSLPQIETTRHYFAPERLQAFSGNGFNLIPDLVEFLDQMELGLALGEPEALSQIEEFYETYTRFINPEYVTFKIYSIKNGDNYWKIAKEYGYTIDSIVGCNPQLGKVICYVNQRILLPSRGGSLHHVLEDETLTSIALDYAVEKETIQEANKIDPHWDVIPGMWLFIPGAKPRYLSDGMHAQYSKRALFRSPLAGRYTSFVGKRIHPVLGFSKFHNGVDIACPMNTWVGAAAAGKVIIAGDGGAIGKYIKIDHGNGYKTVYGHLNQILVRQGSQVKRGQLIGRAGATGRVTGPHLHFTIYDNGRVVDPMDYLW